MYVCRGQLTQMRKLQNPSLTGGSSYPAAGAPPVSPAAAGIPCLVSVGGDAAFRHRSTPHTTEPAPSARAAATAAARGSVSPALPPLTYEPAAPTSRLRAAAAHPAAASSSSCAADGVFTIGAQRPAAAPAAAAAGVPALQRLPQSHPATSSSVAGVGFSFTLSSWEGRRAVVDAVSAAAAEGVQSSRRPPAASSSSSTSFPSFSSAESSSRATFRQLIVQVEHQLVALSDLSCEVKKLLRRRISVLPHDVGSPRGCSAGQTASGAAGASAASSASSSVALDDLYNTFQVLQSDVQLSLTRAGRVLSQLRYQRSAAELAAAAGPSAAAAAAVVPPGSCCAAAQLQHFSETLETLQTEATVSVEALAAQFDRARLQERAAAAAAAATGPSSDSPSGSTCSGDSRRGALRRSRAADEVVTAATSVAVTCAAASDETKEGGGQEKGKRHATPHRTSGVSRNSRKTRNSKEASRSKSGRGAGSAELEGEVAEATTDAAYLVREEAALGESNLLLSAVMHVGGSALETLRAQRNVLRGAQAKLHDMQHSHLLDVRKLLDAITWRRRKNKLIVAAVLAACVFLSFLWVARANFFAAAAAVAPVLPLPRDMSSTYPTRVSLPAAAATFPPIHPPSTAASQASLPVHSAHAPLLLQ